MQQIQRVTYFVEPGVARTRQNSRCFHSKHTNFPVFVTALSHNSLKMRLYLRLAWKPLYGHRHSEVVMDMFFPNSVEFAQHQVQQPIGPASGALADDGENKALRELAALGDRVSAARLIA
ncbi:MAG: hypothetical protein ACRDAM_02635 [Casimicrobium sp.]